MAKFKIGDRVRRVTMVSGDTVIDPPVAAVGEVLLFDAGTVCVAWDDWNDGHNGGLGTDRRDCYWVVDDELEQVEAHGG